MADAPIFATASELALAIRQRRWSSKQIVEAHLRHIEKHNPAINAVVTLTGEAAIARAGEADSALARGELWGPLHGVPFTVKDALETAGVRTTGGYPPLAGYVPTRDATAVARTKAAGAIMLGKTNLPVLSSDVQAVNPIFGRTNNPWDVERTPGGSTGGGAAAVASGMSPLELGSDIGGSVRIPAHFSGIFSLKATENRVPVTGHIPELPGAPRGIRHMQHVGPLARSVEDLALALSIIAGPDGQHLEVPPVPIADGGRASLAGLRVGWTDFFGEVTASKETRDALSGVLADLGRAGCKVQEAVIDGFNFPEVWETWGELLWAEKSSTAPRDNLEKAAAAFRRSSQSVLAAFARGIEAGMARYTELLQARDGYIAAVERSFDGWEVLLCPAAAGPAFTHRNQGTPIDIDEREVPYVLAAAGFTCPFNLTGHPVVVLPMGRSSEGLPIGLQAVARRWDDGRLLAISRLIGQVLGPWQGPPGY